MSKTAQVRDQKKNITTKEKISRSEHSDFGLFWHKKRYIIRIMVFPLDDNFVFGEKYSPTNEVTHPTETPLYL